MRCELSRWGRRELKRGFPRVAGAAQASTPDFGSRFAGGSRGVSVHALILLALIALAVLALGHRASPWTLTEDSKRGMGERLRDGKGLLRSDP